MLAREWEGMVAARVIRRSLGPDRNAVGAFNHTKMLDTRIYDIMFMYGTVQQIAANIMAMSMYAHVDSEGFTTKILDQVQRQRNTDNTIDNYDGYTKDSKERRSRKITTKGYDFLTKFRDGSESWIPLADLKKYNPLEFAEYAISNKLEKGPAFAWWVPHHRWELLGNYRDFIVVMVF